MTLYLVPKSEPALKERRILRIKRRPKPDGLWQCNRCGCRTSVTVENGAMTHNGRKKPGTILHKDICAECWRRDIISPMVPELKEAK